MLTNKTEFFDATSFSSVAANCSTSFNPSTSSILINLDFSSSENSCRQNSYTLEKSKFMVDRGRQNTSSYEKLVNIFMNESIATSVLSTSTTFLSK